MKNYLVLLPLLSLLFYACSDSNATAETTSGKEKSTPAVYTVSDKDLSIDEYIAKVDSDSTPKLIRRSLDFNNDEYYSIYVESWSDTTDTKDMKIIEVFAKKTTSSEQKISYYMRDDKLVATKEMVESQEMDKIYFIERITYYDENEEPTGAKFRKAEYQEDLDTMKFKGAEVKKLSMERAYQVMNQEGAFQAKFVQFFDPGGELWIIVGNPEEGGFRSALLLNDLEGDLQSMIKTPDYYVGRPMALNFQIMRDHGTSYQLLIGASLR